MGEASRAAALLDRAGARATAARVAVLDILLDTATALTHQEIAAAAQAAGSPPDRVTLYRVLDWLVEQNFAHKIAGEDRVWRFNAQDSVVNAAHSPHQHAHFHCRLCGRLYCLDALPAPLVSSLPAGFHCEQVELTLRGICAACADTR